MRGMSFATATARLAKTVAPPHAAIDGLSVSDVCSTPAVLTFIETKLFTSLVGQYLSDDEYAALQQALADNPEAGDVIRGSGAFASAGASPAAANVADFG